MNELDIIKRVTDELIQDAETNKGVLEASAQQIDARLQQLQNELERLSINRVHVAGKIAQATETLETLKDKRAKLDAPEGVDTPATSLPDPIPQASEE
jgi:archaellum component FlaC